MQYTIIQDGVAKQVPFGEYYKEYITIGSSSSVVKSAGYIKMGKTSTPISSVPTMNAPTAGSYTAAGSANSASLFSSETQKSGTASFSGRFPLTSIMYWILPEQ